jgi:hypothetical protein
MRNSQFQRALLGLGIAHRVAPDPQAKGKIERRFGTFQNSPVSVLSAAVIADFEPANALLAEQIVWHNAHHRCRTTGLCPDTARQSALDEKRSKLQPVPLSALCTLHFAIHLQRRCANDHSIALLGRRSAGAGPSLPPASNPSPSSSIPNASRPTMLNPPAAWSR